MPEEQQSTVFAHSAQSYYPVQVKTQFVPTKLSGIRKQHVSSSVCTSTQPFCSRKEKNTEPEAKLLSVMESAVVGSGSSWSVCGTLGDLQLRVTLLLGQPASYAAPYSLTTAYLVATGEEVQSNTKENRPSNSSSLRGVLLNHLTDSR